MRTLVLLLCLLVGVQAADAQDTEPPDGAKIESVDVSGLPLDDLSPGLREDIETLAGQPLDRERLRTLAERIEGEHPDVVAAVRTVTRPNDQARVIFLVARISEDGDLASNINTRYIVESVEIKGVDEDSLSRTLRDELQKLVGARLDHDEAERLSTLLEKERPGYDVHRRISRGSERGRIRVVFEFTEDDDGLRWIPFTPSRSKFVYHEDQGASGALDIPMGSRNHRFNVGFALGNDDDQLGEYSGARFRVESRRLGTERLGAKLEVSYLNYEWRDATLFALAADPGVPEAYRNTITVEPMVTVALTPQVRVSGGVSISELESLSRSPSSYTASAFVAGINYQRRWREDKQFDQRLDAGYELRSATSVLESDLEYTRHLGTVRYRYDRGRSTVTADGFFGGITGTAPLFERFTLGDTSTLRGWNKYDIAPLGGERVFHSSLQYRYRHLAFFLDNGAVWNRDTDPRFRFSTGFGLHGDADGNGRGRGRDGWFITVGFPLNTDNVSAMFMMGVRF